MLVLEETTTQKAAVNDGTDCQAGVLPFPACSLKTALAATSKLGDMGGGERIWVLEERGGTPGPNLEKRQLVGDSTRGWWA